MSLDWYARSDRVRWISTRFLLAAIALFAVLLARNRLPEFPHSTSLQCTFHDSAQHDQCPRFDYHYSKWTAPAASFIVFSPGNEVLRVVTKVGPYTSLQAAGFHYNRPPPLF